MKNTLKHIISKLLPKKDKLVTEVPESIPEGMVLLTEPAPEQVVVIEESKPKRKKKPGAKKKKVTSK